MKLHVLDTHVYIFYLKKELNLMSSLIKKLFLMFEEGECIFYIPTICFWELNRKIITGKIKIKELSVNETLKLAYETIDNTPNFRDLPLTRKAASLAPSFRSKLIDPFDQLIVASAVEANLPLITKDSKIQKSGLVQTVW